MADPTYYVTTDDRGERLVDKAEYVKTERRAGFYNTLGQPNEPATASFSYSKGGINLQGRIDLD